MLTVLVLVCSTSITPDYLRDCGRNNAVQVMQLPEQIASPSITSCCPKVPLSSFSNLTAEIAGTAIDMNVVPPYPCAPEAIFVPVRGLVGDNAKIS